MDEEPGHFEKPFLTNLDQGYLVALKERLETELKDEPYARRHSLMLLLGVTSCLLGQHEEGLSIFEQVLREDDTNLNALKNKEWVSKELGMRQRAREVAERFSDIVENSSPDEVKLAKARGLIQIGRAACYTDQHHLQKDSEYVKRIFETALEKGQNNPDKDELIDWKFGLGYHLFRLVKMVRDINKDDERCLRQGLSCLYEIIVYTDTEVKKRGLHRREEGDAATNAKDPVWKNDRRILDINGKAWVYIGAILNWYDDIYGSLSSILPDCQPAHMNFCGLQCLERAREIAPQCGFVLIHVAQEYHKCGYLEEAIKVATNAIQVLPIGFAFHIRGVIYLNLYKFNRKLNNATKNRENDDLSILNLAIKDLEKAHEGHFRPSYALCDLGIAIRLKGDLSKALGYFKSAETALGGTNDDRMFNEWAKTLDAFGEPEGAREKRACAVEIRKTNIAHLQ